MELHCLGGFVLAVRHRLARTTGDIDYVEAIPRDATEMVRRSREPARVLDAHDLALSKLTRNHPIDREDVAYLARTVPLRADVLRTRYREELRPIIIGDPKVHDRTLDMWIEAYLRH